jgi:hypothetical protein
MCAAVALSALRRWATGYQPGTAKSDEALVRHEVSGGGGFPTTSVRPLWLTIL